MIEVKDLLSGWNNVLVSGEFKKEAVRGAILAVLGLNINSEDVQIKGDTTFLNIKPIYKNEVFLKQDQIKEFLAKTFGQKMPKEIR